MLAAPSIAATVAVAAIASFASALLAPASHAAPAAPPVDFRVGFDSRARLGGTAAITMRLRVEDSEVTSPATNVRIFAPAGLDITSSGLGMATCRMPRASITNVLAGSATQKPCPANSLLGHGTATAMLRFTPNERPILGRANISLYTGDVVNDNPGLTVFVATLNPVSTGLAYTGYLFDAEPPFGLGMQLLLPLIPSPPFGATVSLAQMSVTIGARDIVYTERRRGKTIRYRPEGLGLPARCPKHGFPFRVRMEFANGSRRTVTTRVRCPPRAAPR